MSRLETASGAVSRKRERFSRLSYLEGDADINFCERCGAVRKACLTRALGPQLQLHAARPLITRRIAASPSAARSNANRPGIYRAKWYRRLAFRPTLIAISPTCVVLFALRAAMRERAMRRAAASRTKSVRARFIAVIHHPRAIAERVIEVSRGALCVSDIRERRICNM